MTKITEQSEETRYWHSGRNKKIYEKVIEGKSLAEIREELKLTEALIDRIINNPIFTQRLQNHLNAKMFDFQIQRIRDLPDIYKSLKAEFENRLGDASDDLIVKEFLKFVGAAPGKKKVSSGLVNILLNVVGAESLKQANITPTKIKDIKDHFGYKSLPQLEDAKGSPKIEDSGVDKRLRDKNK
ncbi:hypothetical protein KAW50_03410 [candidate division WOR-3 bacterium]|nr:hypothetical protein [candidate division WOR-3 bacterium]